MSESDRPYVCDEPPKTVRAKGRRRFASLTRTPTLQGYAILYAIDTDGRAWWLSGADSAPRDWTELESLPTYEARP